MEIALNIVRWIAAIPLALLGSDFCGMLLSFLTWGIRHAGGKVFGDSIDDKLQKPFAFIDRTIVAVLFVVFGVLIVPIHNLSVIIGMVAAKVWIDFQRGYFFFLPISPKWGGMSPKKPISNDQLKEKLAAIIFGDADKDFENAKGYATELPDYATPELFHQKLIELRAFATGVACRTNPFPQWQERSNKIIDGILAIVVAEIAKRRDRSPAMVEGDLQETIKYYALAFHSPNAASIDGVGLEVGISFRMLWTKNDNDALERFGRGSFYQAHDQVAYVLDSFTPDAV